MNTPTITEHDEMPITGNDEITIKEEYNKLINDNYSINDIMIYFYIKYSINIDKYDFSKNRIGQKEFRTGLIERFGRCIITGSDIFDACHIIPYSESEDMNIDNGILLSKTYHDYFDKYIWTINPYTFNIEINYNLIDKNDFFIQNLLIINLNFLENYPNMKPYLIKHYEQFKQYFR